MIRTPPGAKGDRGGIVIHSDGPVGGAHRVSVVVRERFALDLPLPDWQIGRRHELAFRDAKKCGCHVATKCQQAAA